MSTKQEILSAASDFTAPFEGFSSVPYQDPGGVWTIGYGSTRDANENPVTENTPNVTESQAKILLARDLLSAYNTVTSLVEVSINTNQTIALMDFVYNLGAGNFQNSTLLLMLNNSNYSGAADQFPRWVYAAGQILPGLVRRREAEKKLFLTL